MQTSSDRLLGAVMVGANTTEDQMVASINGFWPYWKIAVTFLMSSVAVRSRHGRGWTCGAGDRICMAGARKQEWESMQRKHAPWRPHLASSWAPWVVLSMTSPNMSFTAFLKAVKLRSCIPWHPGIYCCIVLSCRPAKIRILCWYFCKNLGRL